MPPVASEPIAKYVPPYDLHHPDFSCHRSRERFKLRYQCFYQLTAFFHVSETSEKGDTELGRAYEEAVETAIDHCWILNDTGMKYDLKMLIAGDGTKAWERVKVHKRTIVIWNSLMKSWEDIPYGTTDVDSYLVNKLLEILWKEKNKDGQARNPNWEPSKFWSAYVMLKLWNHPKCAPPNQKKKVPTDVDSMEGVLRKEALSRKEIRKREQLEAKAAKKKFKLEEYTTKNTATEITAHAHAQKAAAAGDLVVVKKRQQRLDAVSALINNPACLQNFPKQVQDEIWKGAGKTLIDMIAPSPPSHDKKPAAICPMTQINQ